MAGTRRAIYNARMNGVVRLMREIRFSIDRDWVRAAHGQNGFARAHPVTNSWGGWPSATGIAPYLVLRIVVSGMPDPVTGYLVNIQELDALLRSQAIPLAARRLSAEGAQVTGESLVRDVWEAINAETLPARRDRNAENRSRKVKTSKSQKSDATGVSERAGVVMAEDGEGTGGVEVASGGRYAVEKLEKVRPLKMPCWSE